MAPRILLYCLIGGLPFTIAGLGAGQAAWWWLAGELGRTIGVAVYLPNTLNRAAPRKCLAGPDTSSSS